MSVRAKFYVAEVSKSKYASQGSEILTTIKLRAVMGDSEENKEFYRYTPSGVIDLGTVNPKVVDQMQIGDEFYVDFTKAEKAD